MLNLSGICERFFVCVKLGFFWGVSADLKMQRQTRYMERTSSMSRGKRSLEGNEEEQPERKRPALAR